MHHLKYGGWPRIGGALARLMAETLDAPPEAILVPVPLSRRRFRRRGYNQAEALARGLGRHSGRLVRTDLLVRVRETGTQTALALHINTYYWGLDPQASQFIFYAQIAGFIGGIPLARPLAARFDKKIAIVVTCVALSAIPSIPITLRLMGVAPQTGDPSLLPFVITFAGLAAMVGSIMNISVMSALADIADENEVKLGFRQEGVLYSTRALFSKLDSDIGHFFASVALAVIAFFFAMRAEE